MVLRPQVEATHKAQGDAAAVDRLGLDFVQYRTVFVAHFVGLVGIDLVENPEAVGNGLQGVGLLARRAEDFLDAAGDDRQLVFLLLGGDSQGAARAGQRQARCNQKLTARNGRWGAHVLLLRQQGGTGWMGNSPILTCRGPFEGTVSAVPSGLLRGPAPTGAARVNVDRSPA
jgi:hypothetical protein